MADIRVTEPSPGYEVYEIEHPLFRAKVARQGAHLMEWQPAGEEPVLYLSPQAVLQQGKAIRGGIPVCWPWFSFYPGDPSKPSHGFVRTRMWEYLGSESSDSGVKMRFTLQDDEETLAIWPNPFLIKLEILMGTELEVRLTAHNPGPEPFLMGGALHSYLVTGDSRQIVIEGLENFPYQEKLGGDKECSATGESLRIAEEVDRVYHHSGTTHLVDPSLGRVITIGKTGSPSTVVWNSWIEKTCKMADMPDEDYLHFTAVEAVIEREKMAIMEPGDSYVLATRLSIDRL